MNPYAASDDIQLSEDLGMLRMLLQSTPDVVVFKDHQGRWLLANEAAIRLFQLERVDYLGKTDRELGVVHPDFADVFGYCASTDEATWRNGRRSVHEEVVPQPRGEAVILETIKTPIFEPGGDRRGMLLVGRDITERKRMEHEVIRQTVELEKARELNQFKNDFVNAVSHDLRSPITSILGFTELLQEELVGHETPHSDEYVRQLAHNTRRLSILVDDLLDFARIEAGAFRLEQREADLSVLIRNVLDSFLPQSREKRLAVQASLPETPTVFRFDPHRIEQVLTNLVGNAIQYTDAGGAITLRLTTSPTEVFVEVMDTGVGISNEDLPSVFEKFYQVAPQHRSKAGGAGLGLAIAKCLVEAHNGTIGARSTLGQGSTFWFTVPTT